jgi:hypothetical protein
MTTRADYTADEWTVLKDAAWLAAMAIHLADMRSDPLENWQEVQTMIRRFNTGSQLYPRNTLIAALRVPPPPDEARPPAPKMPAAAEMRALALAGCRQAVAVLTQKSTPQEAEEYKYWVLAMAEATARAATERGWLLRNPHPVSLKERALLDELAGALGVTDYSGLR